MFLSLLLYRSRRRRVGKKDRYLSEGLSSSLCDGMVMYRTGGGTTLVLPKGVPPLPPPLGSSALSSCSPSSSPSPSGECSVPSLRRSLESFSAFFRESGRCFSVQLAMGLGEILREKGIGGQTSCDLSSSSTEDRLESSSLSCSTAASCLSLYGEKIRNDERTKRDTKGLESKTRQGSSDRRGEEGGQERDGYHDERTFVLILPSDLHFLSNDAEGRSLLKDLLMALYLSPSYLSPSFSSLAKASTTSSFLPRCSSSPSPRKTGEEYGSLQSFSSPSPCKTGTSFHLPAVRLISEQHVFLSIVTGRRLFSSASDVSSSSSFRVQERTENTSKKEALSDGGTSLSDVSPSQTIEEPRVFTKIREEARQDASSLLRLLRHSLSGEKQPGKSPQSLKKGERRFEEEREEVHDQEVDMTPQAKTKDDKKDSASSKGHLGFAGTEGEEEEDEERERKEHGDILDDPHNRNGAGEEELLEDDSKEACHQGEKIRRTKEAKDREEEEDDDIEEDLHTGSSSTRGFSSYEGKGQSTPFNCLTEKPTTPDCHCLPRHLQHQSRILSSPSPYSSSLGSRDTKAGQVNKTPAQRICLLRYYEGSHVVSTDDEKTEGKSRNADGPNKRRSAMKKSRRDISPSSSSASFSGFMDEKYDSSLSSCSSTCRKTRDGMKDGYGGWSSSCSKSMEVEVSSSSEEKKNLFTDKENEEMPASQNLVLFLTNRGKIIRGKENMEHGETDEHPTTWVSTKTFKKSTPRSSQWHRGVCTPRVIPLKVFESSENIGFLSPSSSPSDAVIIARQGSASGKEQREVSVKPCRDSLRKAREILESSDEGGTSMKSPEGKETTSKVTPRARSSMKPTLPSSLPHEDEEDDFNEKKKISQSRNHEGKGCNAESKGETSAEESRKEERRDWRLSERRSLNLPSSKASFHCPDQEEDDRNRREEEEDAKTGKIQKEMSRKNERLPPSSSSSFEQKIAKDTNDDDGENIERSDSYAHLCRTIGESRTRQKESSETAPAAIVSPLSSSSPSIHKPDKGGGARDVAHSGAHLPEKSSGTGSSSESTRKRRLLPWR